MSFEFRSFAAAVKANGAIAAEDVQALRGWGWQDGVITEAEADALFELNDIAQTKSPEWVDCFVEAVSEFVVNSLTPKGYVSVENAAWLMQRIDKDGRVDTLAELELLVRILEKATNAPDNLKTYAITQIEATILSGNGPTRDGGMCRPATVDEAEVKLLRRLIFAQAGDGPASVSRAEADALFRIKDATLLHNNASGWQQLFVQGVGNHLMAHTSYVPLSRERAAELEKFMDAPAGGVGNFLARMFQAIPSFRTNVDTVFGDDEKLPNRDEAIARDLAITPDEQNWLKAAIDADANLDPLEKALLDFVAAESGQAL